MKLFINILTVCFIFCSCGNTAKDTSNTINSIIKAENNKAATTAAVDTLKRNNSIGYRDSSCN